MGQQLCLNLPEVHASLGQARLSLTPQCCRCAHLSAGVPSWEEEKGLHHGAVVSHPHLSGLGLACRELPAQCLPSYRVHVTRRKGPRTLEGDG